MDERSSRIFFGLCLLVLVWIGVYWMWQPTRERQPEITFAQNPIHLPETETPPNLNSPVIPVEVETETEPAPAVISPKIPDSVPAQSARLIPPEFTQHVVAKGEVMQTIAKSYYGSIDAWTVISKANPTVDPQKLKPGMVLRIPVDKNNIQGILIGDAAEPGVIASHMRTDGPKVIEYVVRPGDSLSVISSRIYGSSRHAQFIFENNRDVLRSIDAISVGQLLKLPPLPREP